MSVRKKGELVLDSTEHLKAVGHETRATILRILEDDPASAKQLSGVLEMTHGNVGHHLKVLREAGLIEVVEERPVRALIERFYGLTYDRLRFSTSGSDRLQFTLSQAALEAMPATDQPFDPPAVFLTVRLTPEKATDFNHRVMDLAADFAAASDNEGEDMYGLTAAIFMTDTPKLGDGE